MKKLFGPSSWLPSLIQEGREYSNFFLKFQILIIDIQLIVILLSCTELYFVIVSTTELVILKAPPMGFYPLEF